MNNLKLFGTIKEVFQQRTGTSKSGNQWWAQDFILEIADGAYTTLIKFSVSGKALNEENTKNMFAGNEVTVSFNLSSRAVQANDGRTFYNTNANAWRIEPGDHTEQQPQAKADDTEFQPTFAPTTTSDPVTPELTQSDTDSELPF